MRLPKIMSGAETTSTLVFARAPVAGKVKTRLIPRLGAEGAAKLHEQLVRHTLAQARAANLGDIILCCTPDVAHPFFSRCAEECATTLWPQPAGDLGKRMYTALAWALQSAARVILVGSDIPALDAGVFRAASTTLESDSDLVLAPAEDGGYALLGARKIDPAIFRDVDWSTARVMRQTRERIRALGWSWRELPTLWDVDRPDDIDRLPPWLAPQTTDAA